MEFLSFSTYFKYSQIPIYCSCMEQWAERLSEVNCKCGKWDYKARNSETEC